MVGPRAKRLVDDGPHGGGCGSLGSSSNDELLTPMNTWSCGAEARRKPWPAVRHMTNRRARLMTVTRHPFEGVGQVADRRRPTRPVAVGRSLPPGLPPAASKVNSRPPPRAVIEGKPGLASITRPDPSASTCWINSPERSYPVMHSRDLRSSGGRRARGRVRPEHDAETVALPFNDSPWRRSGRFVGAPPCPAKQPHATGPAEGSRRTAHAPFLRGCRPRPVWFAFRGKLLILILTARG